VIASIRRLLDLQAGSIWKDLRAILPHVRGSVLDVGCGAQPYRLLFSGKVAYCGIDSIHAKEHFGYESPDVLYYEGESWPIGDEAVDFVLCTETMEHVPEPALLLKEAFRCIAPCGTLLLTVPFAARWHFIPHDYWRFTPSSLSLLLTQAGFVNVRVYARGNALTVTCYKVMALMLPLAFPQNSSWIFRWLSRALFLVTAPLVLWFALLARLSLFGNGGDDCLGYTVLAEKH
jgi:SAM-dependent methyltransferase